MSAILGIDQSTSAVDMVYVDEDELGMIRHERIEFPKRISETKRRVGESPVEHADRCLSHLRTGFPRRSMLEDDGVRLVAIEDPMSSFAHTAKALGRISGGVTVLCPVALRRVHLQPQTWKDATLGAKSATPEQYIAWAVDNEPQLSYLPDRMLEHACAAYCIARAALELEKKGTP